MIKYFRLPFLLLALLALITGLASGLSRMGWDMKMLQTSMHHGSIMVGGFLGTLISLEKVIPLKKKPLFAIPVFSAASVILFFAGWSESAFCLLALSALCLSGVFLYYLIRTSDIIYFMMFCGSICWLVGNMTLISRNSYPSAFPWWVGFLLFVITAERLELVRFLPVRNWQKTLLIALLLLYVGGVLWSFHNGGHWLSGPALIAVSLWLMKHDIVGISIRKSDLQKFIATALLCGYITLLLTGVFLMTLMNHAFGYDAILHTFFLGFVFSMIFAHGPVILPGVLGISAKPWHPIMYLWLVVLHSALVMRVGADVLLEIKLRMITGMVSAICILGYFGTIAYLTIKSQRLHAKVL